MRPPISFNKIVSAVFFLVKQHIYISGTVYISMYQGQHDISESKNATVLTISMYVYAYKYTYNKIVIDLNITSPWDNHPSEVSTLSFKYIMTH